MPARKRAAENRAKRGPGKRAKRQQDAIIPKEVLIADGVINPTKKRSRIAKRLRAEAKQERIDKLSLADGSKKEEKEEPKKEAKEEPKETEKLKLFDENDEDECLADDFELESDAAEENPEEMEDDEVDVGLLEDMNQISDNEEDMAVGSDEDLPEFEKQGKSLKKLKAKVTSENNQIKPNVEIHIDTLDELPTAQELEQNSLTDVDVLLDRIKRNISTLEDFSVRKNGKYSRTEYLSVLVSDLCTYYSYNEFLMRAFLRMFPLKEIVSFLDANEKQRPMVIRTNTLKARRRELAQALISRGVNLDPLEKWSNTGLVIFESSIPIGATPEYLSGHYMLQGASSQLPVLALAPKPGDRILDMAAAPGGKTTHVAAMMRNSGILVANDANKDRIKSLTANLHRLNCCNAIVSNQDGRDLDKTWGQFFNKILLDAPCSGTGVIAKDPQVKINKDENDIKRCSCLQKELILAAIDCLKLPTGKGKDSQEPATLVYCTCSLMVDENEDVVDYIMKKRDCKVVETGLDFGEPGFTKYGSKHYHESLSLTRRYYPHKHNVDGFYVAKIVKLSNKKMLSKDERREEAENLATLKKEKDEKKAEVKAQAQAKAEAKAEERAVEIVKDTKKQSKPDKKRGKKEHVKKDGKRKNEKKPTRDGKKLTQPKKE